MQLPFYFLAPIVVLISCTAQVVQRTTGFGYGIVAMIFYPFLIGSHAGATALSGAVSMLGCIYIMIKYRKKTNWRRVLTITIPALVTLLLSILFMKSQTPEVLRKLLGAFLVIMAIYFVFFGGKIRVKPNLPNALIAGGLGGAMNGLFGAGGPPVVVYLLSSGEEDKEAYLATLQSYFAITSTYALVVRAANGIFTREILSLIPFSIIGLVIGTVIGTAIFRRINPKVLRYCVYAVMALSGIVMLVS